MPSHQLTDVQWQRACVMYFEEGAALGEIADELQVPMHWLTGGDSLVGYGIRRHLEHQPVEPLSRGKGEGE